MLVGSHRAKQLFDNIVTRYSKQNAIAYLGPDRLEKACLTLSCLKTKLGIIYDGYINNVTYSCDIKIILAEDTIARVPYTFNDKIKPTNMNLICILSKERLKYVTGHDWTLRRRMIVIEL